MGILKGLTLGTDTNGAGISWFRGKISLDGRPDAALPESLLGKLRPENSVNLGSTTSMGSVINTGQMYSLTAVTGHFMKENITFSESQLILANRDRFEFTIGVGDRRQGSGGDLMRRFAIATNWHGEDVTRLILTPDPFNAQRYRHTLTFMDGLLSVTDTHSGPNNYGSIRYFTVRYKG
ncbi:hypothetical protein NAE50_000489 [Salmonella enterica]|nr:hypothetical protein [Salmonella enterica]ELX2844669.1 hypothetical protein [Salmonella enterica]